MKKLILVLGFLAAGCGSATEQSDLSGRWRLSMSFMSIDGLTGSATIDNDSGVWFADTVSPARHYSGDISIEKTDGVVSFWFGQQGGSLQLRMESQQGPSGPELTSIDPAMSATVLLSK